jgi:flagellar hook-length control protein FliK
MRIEIPTNNPAPILDREGPKPESNGEKGEPAFFAVIGQMSAEGDHSKQTVERIPSLTADRKEVQKKETEKKGHECERPFPGTMPSAFPASERQQAVAAPDSSRPACESCNTSSADGARDPEEASAEGSAAPPESASTMDPALPAGDVTSPGEPAPEAAASISPGRPSPEVSGEEFDASTDRASQGDVARAEQASVEAAGALFRTLSQPVTNTAPQAGLTARVATPPSASPETDSSQAPAKGASTPAAPGPSVDLTLAAQRALDAVGGARTKAGVLEIGVTAPSVAANDKHSSESFDNQQGAKGGWSSGQHGNHEQAAVSPQALQRPSEVCPATPPAGPGPAPFTSSGRTGSPTEVTDRGSSQAQLADVEAAKSESAEYHPLPDDSASLAAADMQTAQSMIPHSQPARTSATDLPVSGMLRQVQDAESVTSTSWVAGAPSRPNAGGADLNGLSALLAPKHTAPSQEPDFLSQLARRIDMQLRDGENVIRIQLKPSSLGRIEIRAETSGTGVVAAIITESSGVKNYLEHNLHLLQQSFLDQGLKVDRINVTVQEGFQPQHSSSGHQDSRSGGGQQGDSRSPVWHASQFEWSSEELTVDTQTLMALRPHSTFHAVA